MAYADSTMKRKTPDEGLEGLEELELPSKRQISEWPTTNQDVDTDAAAIETASILSFVASASDLQPTQTAVATTIDCSSPVSRASRKFPSDFKTIPCTFPGCDKTFNRPARLSAHLRSHTNDRPHKCPYPGCDKDYLEEKHLTQHIKGSHTHEKRYTCTVPDCNKSFVTATRLRRHAAVHEGAERFRCRGFEGCSQSFRKHQTLQRHIRTAHLGQSAFLCGNDGCTTGFDTAGALRRHIEREHGELKFWCDECANRNEDDDEEPRRVGFTTMPLLQAHMRREHINCMFCDAKCGSQFELERHIDMHHSGTTVEERKTIVCTWEGCDKRFTRQSNLNTHIKTAHEGHRFVCGQVNTFDIPDISDWNWMEEGCGQDFVSKLKLEEHVRFIHLGRKRPPKLYAIPSGVQDDEPELTSAGLPRNIECTVIGCEARFARHYDLNKHIKNDHTLSNGASLEEPQQTGDETPPVAEAEITAEAAFAIDPLLEQQSSAVAVTKGGMMDESFWLGTEGMNNSIPMQQPTQTFDTEWAEMRRLIDIDALIDKK